MNQINLNIMQSSKKHNVAIDNLSYRELLPLASIKVFILAVIMVMLMMQKSKAQSATVCTTAVNIAGFGLDGDLYANWPGLVLGDDWFFSTRYNGSLIGVVGTSAATALPPMQISAAQFQAIIKAAKTPRGRNLTYVQTMSVPSGTNTGGSLLLDAMAARDNIGISGEIDSTVFYTSSSKNGDNPTSWIVGMKSIPQKNDLVDIGGHVRLNTVNGHVYGFAFATTLSSDGDAHLDFEIFRTPPKLNTTTGVVSNSGPASTGGHTIELFNADGSVKRAGDMIIAVDYENGGINPSATVRVWINPNDVDSASLGHDTAYFNRLPNRPFTFTGVYNSGVLAGNYGYAEIRANSNALSACLVASLENKVNNVIGPPWGSLEGSQAKYNDNLLRLQMVEIAIDFTAFGLAVSTTPSACDIYLGDMLVKTRSSPSFTAELKDYAGPYPFSVR